MMARNSQQTSFQVTERDIEIVNFINEFGFCEIEHINKFFGLRTTNCYDVVKRLIKQNFIMHERHLFKKPGVYRVTQAGANLGELQPLRQVALGTYQHQLAIVDVFLKLRELYPDSTWLSERQMRRDKYLVDKDMRGHTPDGILNLTNRKSIPIEVELSMKSKARIKNIVNGYARQFDFDEVWYFCSNEIISLMKIAVAAAPFIKIFSISEFLGR